MKRFKITFKGQVYELDVEEIGSSITAPEAPKTVSASPTPVPAAKAVPSGAKNVISPMPGKILGMHVKKGDCVKRGDDVGVFAFRPRCAARRRSATRRRKLDQLRTY